MSTNNRFSSLDENQDNNNSDNNNIFTNSRKHDNNRHTKNKETTEYNASENVFGSNRRYKPKIKQNVEEPKVVVEEDTFEYIPTDTKYANITKIDLTVKTKRPKEETSSETFQESYDPYLDINFVMNKITNDIRKNRERYIENLGGYEVYEEMMTSKDFYPSPEFVEEYYFSDSD